MCVLVLACSRALRDDAARRFPGTSFVLRARSEAPRGLDDLRQALASGVQLVAATLDKLKHDAAALGALSSFGVARIVVDEFHIALADERELRAAASALRDAFPEAPFTLISATGGSQRQWAAAAYRLKRPLAILGNGPRPC